MINDLYLRRVMIVIAVIGIGVTTYLTIVHYDNLVVLCAAHGNPCAAVQHSIYSHILGIPVAVIGLVGYVCITASLLAPDRDLTRLATLGMVLFGLVFSGYLTYREAFTLHEYCEWCLSSAGLVVLLFVASVIRYVRGASLSPSAPAES